jgi:shikimate dehydrogenase
MIRGTTRVAAVIGWPVEHSRSPQMFAAAAATAGLDAAMIPIGVPPASLAQIVGALRAMRALGASVTVPHKLAVAALCDELSPAAREIGAVNCLRFDGDRLIGHNTDCHGFTDALIAAGFAPGGKRCVILGAGGAARGVAYGLRAAAASAIEVIARRPQQVTWTAARPWTSDELRDSFARADLVVDATTMALGSGAVAMHSAVPDATHRAVPDATHRAAPDAVPDAVIDTLPLDALRDGAWVSTLVYHRRAVLLERASQRGYSTLDGRGMLVHQGARAFALWTGGTTPSEAIVEAMRGALEAALAGT